MTEDATKSIHRRPSFSCEIVLAESIYHITKGRAYFFKKVNLDKTDVNYMHCPFTSALIDGCIEKGQDYHQWSDYSWTALLSCGNTNVADSLAAIQKFVFDDKVVTMEELINALRNNFEGQEDLRLRLLNQAPKFGNDDDYVDRWMREVQHKTNEEVKKYPDYYGNPWTLDGSIAGGYYPWGRRTGALPDGKKYRETFADAVFSPAAGRDKKGPTAVIKSMGKVTPTWPFLAQRSTSWTLWKRTSRSRSRSGETIQCRSSFVRKPLPSVWLSVHG